MSKRAAANATRAITIGENYHRNIGALYGSRRGAVSYGSGGTEHCEWLYAKSYRHPARWRDGGARIERGILILENHLGTEKARFPFPRGRLAPAESLLHGDAFGLLDADGTVQRHSPKGFTGVALHLVDGDGALYWEHGTDITECRAEAARKIALQIEQKTRLRESQQDARRLRLLARISTGVLVTRQDARDTGACVAGINAWCDRVNITADALPARDVFRLATATGERRAMAAVLVACRKALHGGAA
jgi:hypothetical protein